MSKIMYVAKLPGGKIDYETISDSLEELEHKMYYCVVPWTIVKVQVTEI